MTVKVVSEGPTQPRLVVCDKCTYQLEYTGVDVNQVDGVSGCYYYYITCSICKHRVEVKCWKIQAEQEKP